MTAAFSSNVTEARRKFLDAARVAGAEVISCLNPESGPEGEALFTDVACIGPSDAAQALLISSGMHGVEGYAGSAIQIDYLCGFDRTRLPSDAAIVLVHLINPWGAAWGRRENEDNVDVFRNFLYCDATPADNPTYRLLDDAINPREWGGMQREAADAKIAAFIAREGADAFVSAFRLGQSFNPKGMTYHGAGPVWSKRVMDSVAAEVLRPGQSVVAIDVHTGFGAFGKGIVVMYEGQGRARLDFARRVYDELYVAGEHAVVPEHRAMPFDYLEHARGVKVHAVGLEFGTYDLTQRVELFREVNHIFAYGDRRSARAREACAEMRELLNPTSAEWRASVLGRGAQVLAQGEMALTEWAKIAAESQWSR